jgi:predicted acylesterase/phospholipase RssA
MAEAAPVFKRVLYYAARQELADDFFAACGEVATCRTRTGADGPVVSCRHRAFAFDARFSVEAALEALHHGFYNLVLLDLREPVTRRRRRGGGDGFDRGIALLDAMDQETDIERRYGFHRIVALVSGPDALEVDRRIAVLGARGAGRVMRDQSTCHLKPDCDYLPTRAVFARRVLEEMSKLCRHHRGKRALCLSGGGITGLYFELGALKCLEDCCTPGTLNDFDLYFGISAGGVISGMLANGYGVSEFMAAIAGVEDGPLPPLDLNLLDFEHLDFGGLSAPVRQVARMLATSMLGLLRGRAPFSFESLVFEYGDLVHPPFNTSGFEALLQRAFTAPGRSDDFRTLARKLYIGATDQDLKAHVLFGKAPFDDVPVSRAIAASMSIGPVFAPTEINGRYYEDGAVTRTSNFVEAINKGADLIFALDPLVPYVSKSVGFARSRGVVYNADQDIRTVSFTRYETTRNWVIRRHPEVSLYTFLPANTLRRVLSVNPMDHRPYLDIWRGAYLGTLKRLEALGYRLRGDLAFHGIPFDLERARAIGERLEATPEPAFADFFVDRRIAFGVGERADHAVAADRPRRARRSRAVPRQLAVGAR